jgi:hypothetical protein
LSLLVLFCSLSVTDFANNRVLVYSGNSTTASQVFGQQGSFTSGVIGAVTAATLNFPSGIKVSTSGFVYIADFGDNRVLMYPPGSTTATKVYGQGLP